MGTAPPPVHPPAGWAGRPVRDSVDAMTTPLMTTPGRPRTARAAGGRLGGLRTETAYLLLGFPLAIASFVVLVTGLSAAAGTLVTFVGVPLAVATLLAARGFAVVERIRLRALGTDVPSERDLRRPPATGTRWRRLVAPLLDGQTWLETLHGLVAFPVAVLTFCVLVTWWAGAVGGLTYPLWRWALPDSNQGLAEVLGASQAWADIALNVLFGVVFAVTLTRVVHGLTLLQSGLARLLVAPATAHLQQRVGALQESNRAGYQAEASALRRLERDLHDGPQQRLVRLSMDLGAAQRRLADDPAAASPLLDDAIAQTREALAELRALSRGIAPPVLADRGLAAALAGLAARSPVPVDLTVDVPESPRLPERAETTAYFVVAEALTNVAKHSGAADCEVSVGLDGPVLRIVVSDGGCGGAHLGKGHGLAGLSDRLRAVEGRLELVSPVGGPTVLSAVVPL